MARASAALEVAKRAMEEEREALEAIYDSDFEADGSTWRVKLPELNAVLVLRLGGGYPESQPPTPALEFDPWPPGGDVFARRMTQELLGQWDPGAQCVIQWVEYVKEAWASNPADAAAAVEEQTEEAPEEAKPTSVALTKELTKAVGPSLQAAGFTEWSPGLFAHSDRGVTAEVREDLTITVDGVDAEDLVDWAGMQLAADPASFGSRLLEWVTAQRSPEPGFLEEDADGDAGPDFLPSAESLGVKKDRDLLVFTWGKALRKSAPAESEHNFNAGILNGRGGGADLKSMNGLWDEVQSNVASCGLFPRWISMVCSKVEHSNLSCISINCTKGRHRSVAAAEILKKTYYPNATVKHLTIY